MELILGEMQRRFKNSQKDNDSPKIAKDSLLSLLPDIDSILEMTQSFQINKQAIDQTLTKTHILRDKAASVNLIEPLETSHQTLDKDSLRVQFSALMQKLDA